MEEFKEPIHLILTDVVVPGMGGRELVERLKKIHPEMKVLYMSAYCPIRGMGEKPSPLGEDFS